jgi:8-oxo-dGTP pyrophosphatase MutT (NUDIX family)
MSVEIAAVERLDLRFEPKPWAFAQQRRAEIDTLFAARQRANPRLWNGRVLLMHRQRIERGVLHGGFLETDYASFHSWLAWDRPAAEVWDCFGAAVVMASDGAFLLGQMAAHTANAGRIYFPCGTPDPSDVVAAEVDFNHSITRELTEETGLDPKEFAAEPAWTILQERSRLVAYKVLRAPEPGHVLRQRVEAHITNELEGELAAVRLVKGPADLDPAMPSYVAAFLRHRWGL